MMDLEKPTIEKDVKVTDSIGEDMVVVRIERCSREGRRAHDYDGAQGFTNEDQPTAAARNTSVAGAVGTNGTVVFAAGTTRPVGRCDRCGGGVVGDGVLVQVDPPPTAGTTKSVGRVESCVGSEPAHTSSYARGKKQRSEEYAIEVELQVFRTVIDHRSYLEPPNSGPSTEVDESFVGMADEAAVQMSHCKNGVNGKKNEGGAEVEIRQGSSIVDLMGQQKGDGLGLF